MGLLRQSKCHLFERLGGLLKTSYMLNIRDAYVKQSTLRC